MLNSIQALRALAAWSVVLHHVVQLLFDNRDGSLVQWLLVWRAQVGVDVFFVISGFIMVYVTHGRTISPREFLGRRIVRVVPVYWFYTALIALLLLALPKSMPFSDFTPRSLLYSLLFWPHQNPSGLGLYPLLTAGWTLNFEMLFYAVFAISLFFHRPFVRFLAVAALLSALFTFWPTAWAEDRHYTLILEFLYGVAIGLLHTHGRLRHRHLSGRLALLAAALLLVPEQPRFLLWGAAGALLLYAFLGCEAYFRKHRIFSLLGDWSYSTYLCHIPIIALVKYAYPLHTPGISTSALVIFTLASVALVSWLSHNHIERPLLRLLK